MSFVFSVFPQRPTLSTNQPLAYKPLSLDRKSFSVHTVTSYICDIQNCFKLWSFRKLCLCTYMCLLNNGNPAQMRLRHVLRCLWRLEPHAHVAQAWLGLKEWDCLLSVGGNRVRSLSIFQIQISHSNTEDGLVFNRRMALIMSRSLSLRATLNIMVDL